MQLFELVSPRLFRPLAGPNRAFYAELLLLLWEECRHTADYSISRAEAVSRAEDYFAALAKPLALDADGAGDEDERPTRDPHTLAVGFLLRLRRTGWLEEQPGSYESEPTFAFMPEVTPLLDALEEILNPRVVTYTGKLYKAWQLLGSIGQEKSPYENVLREVAADLETLNKSLRALNASIGHYIDRLTHNRTPQEVLELFDQYEEKVVAAAYHRFKTSDNLFNYRAYLEEELDDCEQNQLPRLALDYARVERCAPGEAAPRVRALIQQQRDALEEMSTLMKEIDASHIRYRKRAVQRAQFLLLSDRSAQGSVTALLRRYAEDIRSPEQLFEVDDGPVAARLHLYPAAVFGTKPLYPPAAPRTEAPLAPVRTEPLDPDRLRQVFCNLLDNAAKHGGSGKRIDTSISREGEFEVVRVRDYGPGIPEEELPFVKQKFYKGSSKARGSGIGLAVTEEIVALHGGTLDIASAVGEGTTVTVTLPSAKAEEALGITGAPSRTEEEP